MIRVIATLLLLSLLPPSAQAKIIELGFVEYINITSTDGIVSTQGVDFLGTAADEEVFLAFASSGSISSNLDRLGVGQSTNKLTFRIGGPGRYGYSAFSAAYPSSDFSVTGDAKSASIEFDLSSSYTLETRVNSRDLFLSFESDPGFFDVDGEFQLIGITANPSSFKVQVVPIPAAITLLGSGILILRLLRSGLIINRSRLRRVRWQTKIPSGTCHTELRRVASP